MYEPKIITPKSERPVLVAAPPRKRFESKQNRLMVGALALLLIALGLILYNDRDFWFPDAQDADEVLDQPVPVQQTAPAAAVPVQVPPSVKTASPAPAATPSTRKKQRHSKAEAKRTTTAVASNAPVLAVPPVTTSNRTVLPPLEVEVVAGDNHQTVRPGTNSVRVDLHPGAPAQALSDPFAAPDTTASVTAKASERVQLSAGTAAVVTRSVKPNYPLLARQMKVQGSVILQALIGRDGLIQDLHILSGPPILAGAAEEAVRQWHFKPHYQGSQAVETLAQITVNFTISTN